MATITITNPNADPQTLPLIPKPAKKDREELPIFLRACHSPWPFITQRRLSTIRGLLFTYMLTVLILTVDFDRRHMRHRWLVPFELGVVSWVLQVGWLAVAFVSPCPVPISKKPCNEDI